MLNFDSITQGSSQFQSCDWVPWQRLELVRDIALLHAEDLQHAVMVAHSNLENKSRFGSAFRLKKNMHFSGIFLTDLHSTLKRHKEFSFILSVEPSLLATATAS